MTNFHRPFATFRSCHLALSTFYFPLSRPLSLRSFPPVFSCCRLQLVTEYKRKLWSSRDAGCWCCSLCQPFNLATLAIALAGGKSWKNAGKWGEKLGKRRRVIARSTVSSGIFAVFKVISFKKITSSAAVTDPDV